VAERITGTRCSSCPNAGRARASESDLLPLRDQQGDGLTAVRSNARRRGLAIKWPAAASIVVTSIPCSAVSNPVKSVLRPSRTIV
jgi:hypothetical protein